MDLSTAFRLDRQHLTRRLPPGGLLRVVASCPLQNAAADAALLSLHARVEAIQPGDVRSALEEGSLVMTHSLRGAAYLFPRQDFPVFTHALAPEDEEETLFFIQGAAAGLEQVGMRATKLVDLATQGLAGLLDGRGLGRDELGHQLGQWIGARLSGAPLTGWNEPSPYAAGQTLGESLARFALYVAALRGAYCLAPGANGKMLYVGTEQCLGKTPPALAPGQAAAELARRFLRGCGPSRPAGLAAWAGIHPKQAVRIWQSIAPECEAVESGGHTAWLLRDDLPAFQSAPLPAGARFLPPHDPYLSLPDRAAIVAERGWQRRVWRTVGNPGVLLLDGRFAGIWRGQKQARQYHLTVELAGPLTATHRLAVEEEAQSLASFKNCAGIQLTFQTSE